MKACILAWFIQTFMCLADASAQKLFTQSAHIVWRLKNSCERCNASQCIPYLSSVSTCTPGKATIVCVSVRFDGAH